MHRNSCAKPVKNCVTKLATADPNAAYFGINIKFKTTFKTTPNAATIFK